MKDAERLQHRCPQCSAPPGVPCKLHNGDVMARPHRTRGPGEEARHLQAEIDRRTARKRKAYGPLFQHVADEEVKPETVQDLWWKKRFEAARGAESSFIDKAMDALEWIRMRWVFREVRNMPGMIPEKIDKLESYLCRVYDSRCEYVDMVLCECLTTMRTVNYDMELRFDMARANEWNKDGRYLHNNDVWPPPGYVPPFTRESYKARFPPVDRRCEASQGPDDGSTFALVMGKLGVNNLTSQGGS